MITVAGTCKGKKSMLREYKKVKGILRVGRVNFSIKEKATLIY